MYLLCPILPFLITLISLATYKIDSSGSIVGAPEYCIPNKVFLYILHLVRTHACFKHVPLPSLFNKKKLQKVECWHDKGGVESKQLQLYKTLDEDLTN
jgi:hypothetical protein